VLSGKVDRATGGDIGDGMGSTGNVERAVVFDKKSDTVVFDKKSDTGIFFRRDANRSRAALSSGGRSSRAKILSCPGTVLDRTILSKPVSEKGFGLLRELFYAVLAEA